MNFKSTPIPKSDYYKIEITNNKIFLLVSKNYSFMQKDTWTYDSICLSKNKFNLVELFTICALFEKEIALRRYRNCNGDTRLDVFYNRLTVLYQTIFSYHENKSLDKDTKSDQNAYRCIVGALYLDAEFLDDTFYNTEMHKAKMQRLNDIIQKAADIIENAPR